MPLTFRILAVSTLFLVGAQGAYAEVPQCPGGGTATGTISCSGPIFRPVCTEGPPWTCTLKDDDKKTAEMDGGSPPPKTKFPHVSGSLSEGGGVFDPGTGGGSGGFNDNFGTLDLMVKDGDGGPSFL